MTNSAIPTNLPIGELAKQYTDHEMIVKYTPIPRLANQRGCLLRAFLSIGAEQDSHHAELIALATTLVQTGLDIHDGIQNDEVTEVASFEERRRQLRVLAGDYFSARFYQLLAKAGRIETVHALTDAICEINRMKMDLFLEQQETALTIDQLFYRHIPIRLQLYRCFTPVFTDAYKPLWEHMLERVTRCEWIVEQFDTQQFDQVQKEVYASLFETEWETVATLFAHPLIKPIEQDLLVIGTEMKEHLQQSLKRD
jgi:heptaprenyl diphosphate synthase